MLKMIVQSENDIEKKDYLSQDKEIKGSDVEYPLI
jgi:hypothetical protein